MRSALGQARPDYTWICGICKRTIEGKSNTIHLAIGSHIRSEYRKGLRKEPYSSRQDNDHGRKFR